MHVFLVFHDIDGGIGGKFLHLLTAYSFGKCDLDLFVDCLLD